MDVPLVVTAHEFQLGMVGDVSGNGKITVYDAALIAQYSVGLITEFDAGIWKFSPDIYSFELTGSNEIVDYEGIVIGDPSGNWTAVRNTDFAVWEIPEANLREGQPVNIQLTFEEDFYSILAKISYDSDNVSFLNLNSSDALSEFNILINDTGSAILVSAFGTQSVLTNETILDFAFETIDENVNIEEALNIEYFLFDEEFGGNIQFTDFTEEIVIPLNFDLKQNSPNPFNPTTKIEFSIPRISNVKLDIFNARGQKVKTLINKQMEPGNHSSVWNTENSASGIYFYRITAGEFVQTKKMLLLK
jgi:hypothetical protein